MENHQKSAVHHLPADILTAMASHLEDKSLVFATHVCHFWRSALISFPRLWSQLTFKNERRALVFLERSKSAPVSVDIVGGLDLAETTRELKRSTHRFTTLRAVCIPFLNELLVQPLPKLRNLDVVTRNGFPSVRALTTDTNPDCPLFRTLTNFCFTLNLLSGFVEIPRMEDSLLDFLRGCPLLEAVSLDYGDYGDTPSTVLEFTIGTEALSLPRLRSFTRASPVATISMSLLNRLSLPPTCHVEFVIRGVPSADEPWDRNLSTLRDRSYLSDVTMAKITPCPPGLSGGFGGVCLELINSESKTISLNRQNSISNQAINGFLEFLGGSEITRSVEILLFERCPLYLPRKYHSQGLVQPLLKLRNLKTILFWECDFSFFLIIPDPPAVWCPSVEHLEICLPPPTLLKATELHLERVLDIALSRNDHGIPLKTVTLSSNGVGGLLREWRGLIEELSSCVELVEFA